MSGSRRKTRIGQVVSDKADKTVVVAVEWRQQHPLYSKSIRRISRFSAHDEQNLCHIGDQVRIVETRPLSKTKRWRVLEILAKGEVPEIRPQEIDITLEETLSAATTGVRVEEIPAEAPSSMAPGIQVPPVEAPVAEAAAEPREAQVSPVEAQVTEVAREPEAALVPPVEAQVMEAVEEPETTTKEKEEEPER